MRFPKTPAPKKPGRSATVRDRAQYRPTADQKELTCLIGAVPALLAAEPDEQPAANGHAPTYATIIAEAQTEIARLTVSDAVMRMDLADQKVLMFRNSGTGELNVIYRRPDGNIGWIDPANGG